MYPKPCLSFFPFYFRTIASVFLLVMITSVSAIADPMADTIERFIQEQTASFSGEVTYTVSPIAGKANLPACSAFQAFLPNGSPQMGNTTVGLRCLAPSKWSIFVPVKIKVIGRYLVTAQALANGQVVTMNDFNEVRGDIAALPSGAITQREQAIGKVLRFSISAGQILRAEHLTSQVLVRQNQSVRVMVAGPGFKASTEGKALNNGSEGQSIQVRTASGSTVSGIVQADGSIIVPYGK